MNKLQRFISQTCATYDSDGNCHLETGPNGERTCVYFLEHGERCIYAERSVIPGDERIQTQYWLDRGLAEWNEGAKVCKSCSRPFKPRGNRQTYCKPCGQERKRKQKRTQNQRYYIRKINEE